MNHWTARELQLLREHYPSHGSSWDGWAALLPSRTKYAIDMAVKRYGLGYVPKTSAKEVAAPADRYEPLLGCPFCGAAPKVERSADRTLGIETWLYVDEETGELLHAERIDGQWFDLDLDEARQEFADVLYCY